ncbi:MAG: UPF0175 family protein [Spirulinaceae cyanobacterium]
MQITLDLPDEYLAQLQPDLETLPQRILELLVVEAYNAQTLTHAEVGRILGFNSRWDVDAFLKEHHADLHYDETDLESDLATLQQLQQLQRQN